MTIYVEDSVVVTESLPKLLQREYISEGDEKIFQPQCLKSDDLKISEICFYKINRLTFDEEYPHREAFENVLQALNNNAFNFVYILDGEEDTRRRPSTRPS